jgi:hypothetical protein
MLTLSHALDCSNLDSSNRSPMKVYDLSLYLDHRRDLFLLDPSDHRPLQVPDLKVIVRRLRLVAASLFAEASIAVNASLLKVSASLPIWG